MEPVLAEVEVVLDEHKDRVLVRTIPLLLKELMGQDEAQERAGSHTATLRQGAATGPRHPA